MKTLKSAERVAKVREEMRRVAVDCRSGSNELTNGANLIREAFVLRLRGGRWGVGVYTDDSRYSDGGRRIELVVCDDEADANRVAWNATNVTDWKD